MAKKIEIQIVGDADRLVGALRKSEGALGRFGKHTTAAGRATHAFKVAGLAAIPVVGLLAYQLHDAVEQAAELETSTTRLKNAVQNSGQVWKKQNEVLDEAIKKQSLLGAFTLPETTDSMARLELSSGKATEAIKLNALAMDIARGTGKELAQTSILVSKAYQGNVTGLKRLGIALPVIGKHMSAVAARQRILNYLSKKFGGDAAAYGKTGAGALQRLNLVFDRIKETIGAAVLPVIKKLADKFSAWLGKASTTKKINQFLHDTGVVINKKVIPAVKDMYTAFESIRRVIVRIKSAWDSFANSDFGGVLGKINDITSNLIPGSSLLKKFTGSATGGLVTGGVSGRDSVPLMAAPGEVVLNRQAQLSLVRGQVPGSSRPMTVNLVLDRRVLASVLVGADRDYARHNGGRGLFA